jgi:hypothetical protein
MVALYALTGRSVQRLSESRPENLAGRQIRSAGAGPERAEPEQNEQPFASAVQAILDDAPTPFARSVPHRRPVSPPVSTRNTPKHEILPKIGWWIPGAATDFLSRRQDFVRNVSRAARRLIEASIFRAAGVGPTIVRPGQAASSGRSERPRAEWMIASAKRGDFRHRVRANMARDLQLFRSIASADTVQIRLHRDTELPVRPILRPPVPSNNPIEALGG